MDFLKDFFRLNDAECFSFQVGYVSGIAVFISLFMLFSLAYWILFRYPRRSKGVAIRAHLGVVFISSAAISDLLKSLESEFKSFEIVKVLLLDCKKFNRIEIHVNYLPGEEGVPALSSALQERAMDTLKSTFGIESVRDIVIRVRRAKASNDPFA